MSVDAPSRIGLHDCFHLKSPAPAVARVLRKIEVALTQPGWQAPNSKSATPALNEDAYILNLHRKDLVARELRFGARPVLVVPFPEGLMSLINLALDPTSYRDNTFDHANFFLRRETFDRLADDLGANRIDDLAIWPGVATKDPVVNNLGSCLRLAIKRAEQVSSLFVDHVVIALHTHLAKRYGGMRVPRTSGSGSLTPWQLRIARDTIDAHLEGDLSLAQIANACGLSVSHFARAFTYSTGAPPHRWLMQRRVERAKDLMRTTRASLAEIAFACGFSDQSHFSRVFSQIAGTPPGQWRRLRVD